MAEVLLIAPVEIAAGFRLAGLEVLPARGPQDVLTQLEDARSRENLKLAFVAEHFLTGLTPPEYARLLHSEDPWFIPVPLDAQGGEDDRRDFEGRLGRILGCRISLSEQLLGGGTAATP